MEDERVAADVANALSRHVRIWRAERGYSQETLAIKARLSTPTYRRIECAERDNPANPTLHTMVTLLSALGTADFVMKSLISALDHARPE
ncbi:helix-turn-helix domain-containing protein [Citricoccus sp. NR2]|uniref:helix-turn-helix domain-containing protein n=1 Tax=Citricoccus sp. NR2 TaxID=3004095 RepID=UPI003FA4860D